jgi:hypothetical protein
MLLDIIDEIERKKLILEKASNRLNDMELCQEDWDAINNIRSVVHKLEARITNLEDSLVKTCTCLNYYNQTLKDIENKSLNKLQNYDTDPINNDGKMQYLKSLIGGFNTIDDIKNWKEEIISNESNIIKGITGIEEISNSIEEWGESFFIPMDYVEGLLKGLLLAQDKRINMGIISWETIMSIYLGLNKYYIKRYKKITK